MQNALLANGGQLAKQLAGDLEDLGTSTCSSLDCWLLLIAACAACADLFKRCEQIRSLFCRTTALCVITFGHSPQHCCKGKPVILEAFLFTDRGHVLQSVPVFWRVYTIHWMDNESQAELPGWLQALMRCKPTTQQQVGRIWGTCCDMLGSSGVTMGSARGFQALRGLTGVQQGEMSDWQSVTVPLCHCAADRNQCVGVLGRHAWRHSLVALLPQIGLVGSLWDSNDRLWTWQ